MGIPESNDLQWRHLRPSMPRTTAAWSFAMLGFCSASRVSPARLPPSIPQVTSLSGVLSRRAAISTAAAFALAPALEAHAEVKGANQGMPRSERDISAFLVGQGLPPLPSVPSGLSPLVQYIGTANPANIDGMKVKERGFSSTLLVRFFYPSGWLVETPTITENGEAGKIAANNYQKGDSADFVAVKLPEGKKLKPTVAADGTPIMLIDFTYTLLTRAGFSVDRKGVASAMLVNDSVCGVVLATTEQRFKELELNFRQCAESFRAYAVNKPSFFFS